MRRFSTIAFGLLAALALFDVAAVLAQQPDGEPFSRSIRKLKEGFYVVPGYDGATTASR